MNIGNPGLIMIGWLLWKRSVLSTIVGGVMFNQDFKEFIQLLNDNQVHYLVIGGNVVAIQGRLQDLADLKNWNNAR
jgi:hypothetical protein